MSKDIKNWVPNNDDFALGKCLIISKDYSKVVERRGGEGFHYRALLYSILSLIEHFNSHQNQFNEFLINNLGTSESIIKNKRFVEKILNKYAVPSRKIKSVLSTAEKWRELNLTERIRDDKIKNLGFLLRQEMVEKMFGVGYKFASLFLRMSGYENIFPVDTWAIKYAELRGFKYRDENSGLKHYRYLKYKKN